MLALVSNGNAAAIGLLLGDAGVPLGQSAGAKTSVAKSSKTLRWLLTLQLGGDYIRLTNEGGSPLATKKFASKPAL